MLSRFALKSGTFGRIALTKGSSPLIPVGVRLTSSSSGNGVHLMQEEMARWEVANEVFYGKDRDNKNFPILRQQERPPPTRFAVLPDSWFMSLYNKTGVSGSYLLINGLAATLFSKEIIAIDHGTADVMAYFTAVWLLAHFLGPRMNTWFDKVLENDTQRRFIKPIEKVRKEFTECLDVAEKDVWRKQGQKYVFESMKENIDLQLEASYRKRLSGIYTDVKKRLDYQLEIQNAKRRFEQENMVNWITKNVISSITPKQEKETLAQCIQTLKNLSKTQAAV